MKSLIFGKVSKDNFHSDILGSIAPGEDILVKVEQPRLFKSLFNPASIYITPSRIMRRDSRFFGLFSSCVEFPLSEILSVEVAHNLMFSNFYATLRFSKEVIGIDKIPKKGAMLLQQKVRHPFSYMSVEHSIVEPEPDIIVEALRCKIKNRVLNNP